MSTRVTLQFITDEDVDDLQRFLDGVKDSYMLNSNDNEEGHMVAIRDFRYETEQA